MFSDKFSIINQKYFFLRKKLNYSKTNSLFNRFYILRCIDSINLTNKPQIFYNYSDNIRDIQKLISEKIMISSSNRIPSRYWEILSGRAIKNIFLSSGATDKIILCKNFDIVTILGTKYTFFLSFSTGQILRSIQIEPIFPVKVQLIKDSCTVLILNKFDEIISFNYQKGYFLKKFKFVQNSFFLNGTIQKDKKFCIKKAISLNVKTFLKKASYDFHTTDIHPSLSLQRGKFIYEFGINLLFFSFIFLLQEKNHYLWDITSKLIVFPNK